MGYYTYHSLEVVNEVPGVDHHAEIAEIADYKHLWSDSVKWYSHQEEMLEYSKSYPYTEFILDGDGEETGDIWREWYKNGRMQRWDAKVERPDQPPEPW